MHMKIYLLFWPVHLDPLVVIMKLLDQLGCDNC